jgi:hypothetical protein
MPTAEKLFDQSFVKDIKRDLIRFRREGNPPICTHELLDKNDPLFHGLLRAGLDNKEDDRVKVIIYPAYLDGADSLMNLPYFEAIVGTHLGLFPSYYEPWGYTPVESASLAVPNITTDLAGFGRFIKQRQTKEEKGIWIMPRLGMEHDEEVDALYRLMLKYARFDHTERVENRLYAKQLSALGEWKHFAKHYFRAHKLALEKVKQG